MNNATTTPQKSRGRRQLLLLAALFFGPLGAAWIWYFGNDEWHPTGTTAHGELLQPIIALPDVSPDYLFGENDRPLFRKSWVLTIVSDDLCTPPCRDALVKVRQIRLALGRTMERVSRVVLVREAHFDVGVVDSEHPGLLVVDPSSAGIEALIAQFPDAEQMGEWIYLVDPLGNLMMRYRHDEQSKAILDDLKHLLKISRIG